MEIIKEVVNKDEVFEYGLSEFEFTDDKFKNLNSNSIIKIKSKEELKELNVQLDDEDLDKIAGHSFFADALTIITYIQSEGKYFGRVESHDNDEKLIDILADWCDVCDDNNSNEFETFDMISSLSEQELQDIVDEMISKISKDELEAIFSLINYGYGRREHKMKSEIAEKYITTWAKNKAFMYLAMGRNLIIEKSAIVKCSDNELQSLWIDKCNDFLFGRTLLRHISQKNIVNNSIELGALKDLFHRVYDAYDCVEYRRLEELISRNQLSTKMKLTKVISKVFEDEKLNIELSKALQGKEQKHVIKMSIHPLDYLTCSMAKKWHSCHKPTGQYQGGPISYMLDSATVMTYTSSDNMLLSESKGINFDYFSDSNNWKSFVWNNKTWRSLFYVNNKNFSATFYREYPSPLGNMFDIVRLWYEELISNYLQKENVWEDRKMFHHLKDNSTLHYNDPIHFRGETSSDKHLHHVSLPNVKFDETIYVGHNAFNLENGNLTSNKTL